MEKTKIKLTKDNLKCINIKSVVIKRCNYCRTIMPIKSAKDMSRYTVVYKNGYCSKWCYEMDNLPEVKHICYICGMSIAPYKRKNGYDTGIYPKNHKECLIEARKIAKEKSLPVKLSIEILRKKLNKESLLDRLLDSLPDISYKGYPQVYPQN